MINDGCLEGSTPILTVSQLQSTALSSNASLALWLPAGQHFSCSQQVQVLFTSPPASPD